jgi:hypothetical protein
MGGSANPVGGVKVDTQVVSNARASAKLTGSIKRELGVEEGTVEGCKGSNSLVSKSSSRSSRRAKGLEDGVVVGAVEERTLG